MVNASGYLLSIIIPTYNNAELITATLASIHQSITDDVEVIIVNDGSTDLTEERINAFYREKDCHNVKYISQKNQGVAITGNDSNLLIVFYVQIMPDDFVMQLHRF
ncbi:glycosyltransferase family A protein [Citrobacter freundii]|uniref:glycosyltransferase family 2 protein n=1 Tax=Citrobacter freundii TaxID=546 RepID=UPI0024A7A49C|nr:glycosyltransferase family A protein [Citrobacter freundii]WHE78412.1 glycosyltransferase family A protein [Citrobacter freundii]